MRSFTIATDRIGPRRWCWVRVHDTVEQLRTAAQRLNPRVAHDRNGDGWQGCYGVFQPSPSWHNDAGETWWHPNGYAGTIRVAKGHVTAEIVAHELVHAATQIYRMNVRRRVQLGTETGQREEDLAYIYGELSAALYDHLDTFDGAADP